MSKRDRPSLDDLFGQKTRPFNEVKDEIKKEPEIKPEVKEELQTKPETQREIENKQIEPEAKEIKTEEHKNKKNKELEPPNKQLKIKQTFMFDYELWNNYLVLLEIKQLKQIEGISELIKREVQGNKEIIEKAKSLKSQMNKLKDKNTNE